MIITKQTSRLFLTLLLILSFSFHIPPVFAEADHKFRNKFIQLYNAVAFKEVEKLIKKNKDMVLVEARTIFMEAQEEERPFGEKMFLVNLSNKLTLFYQDFFEGGKDLLKELKAYQTKIVKEEEEKNKKLMKWKNLEKIPGNFVLKRNWDKMKEKGVSPVLYPHWLHRTLFACKVCHNDIFKMDRWANEITMDKIKGGELCGTCHNDKIAFGVKEDNCIKCHMAGTPEGEHLHNLNKLDHEKIKAAAERVGGEWNPENMTDGKLPLDRFGFINWVEMDKKNVYKPLLSLKEGEKNEILDNEIVFESTSTFVQNVLFSHKVHSTLIKCDSCHPEIFKKELGKNKTKMKAISQGRYCGHCHGKVSFTFKDCMRCHKVPKGKIIEGALQRQTERNKMKAKKKRLNDSSEIQINAISPAKSSGFSG